MSHSPTSNSNTDSSCSFTVEDFIFLDFFTFAVFIVNMASNEKPVVSISCLT